MAELKTGVRFLDGPLEGAFYPPAEAVPASVLAQGDGIPEGQAARYRYRHGGYRFHGLERVVMALPAAAEERSS